jgi:hypothetical protein
MGPVPHRHATEIVASDSVKCSVAGGASPLGVGSRVLAQYCGEDGWFPGVVTKADLRDDDNVKYTVEYDGFEIDSFYLPVTYKNGNTINIRVRVTGVGDLAFHRAVQGRYNGKSDGYRYCDKKNVCNKCVTHKADLQKPETNTDDYFTYVTNCHLAHMPAHQLDFPFSCPGKKCKFKARSNADILADKKPKKPKDHNDSHKGMCWQCDPALPIEPYNYDACMMHGRHCLASFVYEHGIMDHIDFPHQEEELLEKMVTHKIDMRKSKCKKRKRKDTDSSFRKKPHFIGNNDVKMMENFKDVLNVVSPEELKDAQGVTRPVKSNIDRNVEVMRVVHSWSRWRNAVYDPLVDKFPTKQQLKGKHDRVKKAATDMYRAVLRGFDGHAIPYMHELLHCEGWLQRDVLDRSGESMEHKNKKLKADGKLTGHHIPSVKNAAQSVAKSVLQAGAALDAALDGVELPSTVCEKRRIKENRKYKTVVVKD